MNPLKNATIEIKKRKRELIIAFISSVTFICLSFLAFQLTTMSRLPFEYSIFFFGLVNINVVLLLFLLFLIFRNIVKSFVEKKGRIFGSSLRAKLVASFVAFSSVPTIIMFVISVFYINSSFDRWFSDKMAGVLKDALEVSNAYYTTAKKKNYHYAHQIKSQIEKSHLPIQVVLENIQKTYNFDSIEFYPDLFGDRYIIVSKTDSMPNVPKVSLEFLKKGIIQKSDASTVHHFQQGNLVRVIVSITSDRNNGALVISSFVPMSLISKMDDIARVYEDFRDLNPLEYPLKSIYLIILVLMTLVILLAATWFGFHLAKELSIPLETLGEATQKVSKGDYQQVLVETGSEEIHQLIKNFNLMTKNLDKTNSELNKTIDNVETQRKYIEVVLSNISTAVMSVDEEGKITTLNRRAGKLLKIEPEKYIGRKLEAVMTDNQKNLIHQSIKTLSEYKAFSIQKDVKLEINGESTKFQMTLSLLRDDKGENLGMVLVFDDLSIIENSQRAAAWREVAKRIAHEIKNPLTPIKLSAQRLQKKFSENIQDPAFNHCIEVIIDQVDELKCLVDEFNLFARLPQANPTKSDINKTIEDILVLYTTGHKLIHFEFRKDSDMPHFNFDSTQMKRVFTNLIDNAIGALNDNGKIDIQTKFDAQLNMIQISISDNGKGINPSDRKRIFEPYFSTKVHGSGLGLAIVKRIIEDHNGFVRVFPNKPNGTQFVIELPIQESSQLLADKGV